MAAVGAPSPRRAVAIPTAPLPANLRAALTTIAKALRNVPRDAIHDPPELFVWLNRQAKALERARDTPLALPMSLQATRPTSAPLTAPASPPRILSAREKAEAVFRAAPPPTADPMAAPQLAEAAFRPTSGALPRPRIVVDRRGRRVQVEVRRAREAGQLEMPL